MDSRLVLAAAMLAVGLVAGLAVSNVVAYRPLQHNNHPAAWSAWQHQQPRAWSPPAPWQTGQQATSQTQSSQPQGQCPCGCNCTNCNCNCTGECPGCNGTPQHPPCNGQCHHPHQCPCHSQPGAAPHNPPYARPPRR